MRHQNAFCHIRTTLKYFLYHLCTCTLDDLANLRLKTHLSRSVDIFITQKQNFGCKYFRVGCQNYCVLNVKFWMFKSSFHNVLY